MAEEISLEEYTKAYRGVKKEKEKRGLIIHLIVLRHREHRTNSL